MNIDQSIIDEVIRKSDIVDVISKNLKVKKSGSNYFACCPFHNEKSASFSINSNKQFFHCFGCGESGNVITFIMKYNGLDFVEAVKYLAQFSGVHIPESSKKISKQEIQQKKEHKLSLNDTINQVVRYYQNNLVNSSMASHYLSNRGLTNEIVQKFSLGYVPNTPNPLSNVFKDYQTNKYLFDAGLILRNDNGKIFDRFRDRVMFPIRNVRGDVIAFGGRIIVQGEPKYLNSPETELFNKSQELYGLFESQKQIREKNQAIVVEGYMDVIAMHQFSLDNVVASMGTAATEEQIKKLFRLCDDIYFCFDGDKAGHKAAWRALERSIPLVTDTKAVHFIFLPEEHDPDSFLRQHGAEHFKHYEKNHSLSMSSFLLNQLSREVNTNSNEGKAKLVSLAKPYIEQVSAIALQVILKKQLANLVELEPNVLESILNNRSRYAFYTQKLKTHQLSVYKEPLSVLNSIEIIISNALKNISWVIKYKLPEDIDKYSREIQELILLLDFINHNYDSEAIELYQIKENFDFAYLNLDKIYSKVDYISLTHQDFILRLDSLFHKVALKANKVPKITMKGNNHEE